MGITPFAQYFSAVHPKASIFFFSNFVFCQRRRKTWPTGAGVKLLIGAEKIRPAANTFKNPFFMRVQVLSSKGWLGALLPCYIVLLPRELLLPLLICFRYLFITHRFSGFSLFECNLNRMLL